jgi:hypothetical protein
VLDTTEMKLGFGSSLVGIGLLELFSSLRLDHAVASNVTPAAAEMSTLSFTVFRNRYSTGHPMNNSRGTTRLRKP